jgi:feruloyl-CoA synthase
LEPCVRRVAQLQHDPCQWGTLHIDDGKPGPGLFERTLENLAIAPGTLSFNVPVGYAMLANALAHDKTLRDKFFEDLDLMFYAGTSLLQDVWTALETMAIDVRGEVPLMTTSWGLTETAPAILLQSEPIDRSGIVGVPLARIDVKLVPHVYGRCRRRLPGPQNSPRPPVIPMAGRGTGRRPTQAKRLH